MRRNAASGQLPRRHQPSRLRALCAAALLLLYLLLGPSAAAEEPQPAATTAPAAPTEAPVTFEEHIRPILQSACFQCHGGEGKTEGGLDVRLRRLIATGGDSGPAIVPGKRAESLAYSRALAGEMPPNDHKLTAEQIELVGRWIDAGAPTKRDEPADPAAGLAITPEDRAFWAFQPIARPEIPQNTGRANPIDSFIAKPLADAGLELSPEADKRTLLLRASFDLTGLPPTADEVETFLNDSAPDAYERLVDRLLASPHYGERWGRHWLDVAGYAESDGYVDEDRARPYAYKYRDYVIRAFNADKPFDQFIVEQMAGDELIAPPYANMSADQIEKLVATGYLRMAVDGTGTAAIDENLARNYTLADTVKIVSTSLLGLSVGCAQCHDHRYDPIPQTDYYRMRAVFEPAYNWKAWQTREGRLISLYTDADREKVKAVDAEISVVATERGKKQDEFMAAALEKELEKYPAEQRDTFRTACNTPEDKRTDEQKKLLDDNPSLKITPGVLYQYNQAAADELKKFDTRIEEIGRQKPFQDFLHVLTEPAGQVPQTFLFHRGDYNQPQQEVQPGDLTVCAAEGATFEVASDSPDVPTSGRRLAYARYLTSGKHPLVARVLVNRIWMHHFGQGIVGTPSDFGRMGELPTNPALLDWLATQFVDSGWKLKQLHKLIMLSDVYRQASTSDERRAAIDADNRLLWRQRVRRLDAEAIRDRVLATSGAMNGRMFGPSTPVAVDNVGQVTTGESKIPPAPTRMAELEGGDEARRSVYLQVRRSQPIAMLRTFDAPVMETNCDRRVSSTVSPQALMLMNSTFVVGEARRFALRVRLEAGADPKAQIAQAWQLAYARAPAETELASSEEFLRRQVEELSKTPTPEGQPAPDHALQALTDLCHVLLGSNEFLYVD